MKIIKVECPSCGSNLNATDDLTRVICKFCGATVIVEDSEQEGYHQGLGMMRAKSDSHIKLANEIDELTKPLIARQKAISERNSLTKKSENLQKEIDCIDKTGKVKLLAKAGGSTVVIYLILMAAKGTTGAFVFFGISCCLMFLILAFMAMTKRDNLSAELENAENLIVQNDAKIDESNLIISKHPDISIPSKYVSKRALGFIRDSIRSQQAITVEHAIALYEQVLRDEKTISLQKEQIRLQQQQIDEMRDIKRNTQYERR